MKNLFLASSLLLSGLVPTQASTFWDLNFSGAILDGMTRVDDGLGNRYDVSSMRFLNIAPGNTTPDGGQINLRVTTEVLLLQSQNGGVYNFNGFFPDYRSNNGLTEPNDDLGILYTYSGGRNGTSFDNHSVSIGGVRLTFTFYDGGIGSGFEEELVVPTFRILAYDVDGDADSSNNNAGQQESITAYLEDGFYAYQRGTKQGTQPLIVNPPPVLDLEDESALPESYSFSGIRENINESDPRATVLLWFQNTSSFKLDLITTTNGSSSGNPVFTAIDGDLSLIGGNDEEPEGFEARVLISPIPVPVPEPSTYACIAAAGIAMALFRRRHSRR